MTFEPLKFEVTLEHVAESTAAHELLHVQPAGQLRVRLSQYEVHQSQSILDAAGVGTHRILQSKKHRRSE